MTPTTARPPARPRRLLAVPAVLALVAGVVLVPPTAAAPTPAGAPAAATPVTAAAAAPAAPSAAPASRKGPIGWDVYRDLGRTDELTTGVTTHQFSSFDRTGGNGQDGFDGRYSCLRTTDAGCVIAETQGAGEIESIWFTRDEGDVTRTGDITVELDGKQVLHAPLQDVVDGKLGAPFVHPFVANADQQSGGVQIKVPMPYRSSMRVTTDANPLFYHVTYRSFPDAVGVKTFDPADTAADVIAAAQKWGTTDPKPAARRADTTSRTFALKPGATTTLADVRGTGTVRELKIRVPQIVGPARLPVIADDGRATKTSTRFTVAIDPANQGVKLTRRFDANSAQQVADIWVDGTKVGRWEATDDVRGYWSYQTVTLPASATAGKSSITVENRFVSATIDWNEFRYWVDSVVGGTDRRTDELDVGTSTAARASETAHDYAIVGETWNGTPRQTDEPTDTSDPAILQGSELLRDVMVRVTVDGQRTVDSPLGEFFGSGLLEKPVGSLFFAMDPDGWYTAWWPMPYGKRVTVQLVNGSDVAISSGSSAVTTATDRAVAGELRDGTIGLFRATHHRAQTVPDQDWEFLDVTGHGKFVGVAQTVRGNKSDGNIRNYLEGDERVYVDGSRSPQVHGTGTEDFYEAGWYFNRGEFSEPFTGATAMPTRSYGCTNQCDSPYRLMIGDAVPFHDRLVFDIEPGSESRDDAEYSSTAFWYGEQTPAARTTDTLDLGDARSIAQHRYSGSPAAQPLTAFFEGEFDTSAVTDQVTTATGPVTFTLTLDPRNQGVQLRRLADQAVGYQQAAVAVDGTRVGTWQQPLANTTSRWLEDSFPLPASATAGKRKVTITLTPATGSDPIGWTAAQYQAVSLGLRPSADRTAPSGVGTPVASGTESNSTRLSWASATDDVSVAGYQVFASQQRGFRPSRENLVATAGLASFVHTDLGLGQTWYYRVRAVDSSGNTGPLSREVHATTGNQLRIEGEQLLPAVQTSDLAESQGNCCGVQWSGGAQLWLHSDAAGDAATLRFRVPTAGTYRAAMVQTQAPDYGIVQVSVDGKPAGAPTDNYRASGVGTATRDLGTLQLTAGEHTLTLTVTGKNPAATSAFVGFDVLTLQQAGASGVTVTGYRRTDTVVAAGARQRIYDPSVDKGAPWYINDHTFVKGPDGRWNLFGITHAEPAAPLDENHFAHATATSLTQAQWTTQPDVIPADLSLGEKHVWAPYVLRSGGTYYMFYAAGLDDNHSTHQLRLATSPDLKTWTKRAEPLFTDGYDARDPMVLRVGSKWVMYYTANSTPDGGNHQVAYRTSTDLVHWGAKQVAFQHPATGTFGGPTESPFVVAEDGWYYLFVCCDSGYTDTRVYRSRDPLHFEYSQQVGQIDEHAAEVVQDDAGRWWISGAGWGAGGVWLRPLQFDAQQVTAGQRITTPNYRMTVQTAPRATIESMDVADGSGGWRPVLDSDYRGTSPYLAVGTFGNTDRTGAAAAVAVQGSTVTMTGIPLGDEPATADWRLEAGSAGVTSAVTVHVTAAPTAPVWEMAMTFDGAGARTGDDVDPDRPVGDIPGFSRWSQSTGADASFAAVYRGGASGSDNRYVAGSGAVVWQPWWVPGGRVAAPGDRSLGTFYLTASPVPADDTLGARAG